jgi:hypothetical protein
MNRQRLAASILVVPALLATWLSAPATAQKPGAAQVIHPQAPSIDSLSATGMRRGTTVELHLKGAHLTPPLSVLAGFPATATIPEDGGNGQDPARIRVRIDVPADAPLGFHSFRVFTHAGVSNFRLFCIDELPELPESDTNRDMATPQELQVPCVVSGRLGVNKSAWYSIRVGEGQYLSFDVLGRRLGGPIDPEITLYDAKSQRELAYDNDSPGCQGDPRLRFHFTKAGTYLLEVKDVQNRGGPDYLFRMRIGDFPLAIAPMPLAAQRGQEVKMGFVGTAVEDAVPVDLVVPKELHTDTLWVTPRGRGGLAGWPVALAVTDIPEQVAGAANLQAEKALRLQAPVGISARFVKRNETHYYRFFARKGQKLLIEAQALELGSPAAVIMGVQVAKTKKEVARSKPENNPPEDQVIDFTAPQDDEYLLAVNQLHGLGGPSQAYRLAFGLPRSGFELLLGADRFDLAPGGFAVVPVQVLRSGYAGPLEVTVQPSAGLSGKATIAAGKSSGVLLLQAERDLALQPHIISIVGEAKTGTATVRRLASVRPTVVQGLGNLARPPRHLISEIAVGVREPALFRLTARLEPPSLVPGTTANLSVRAERDDGFEEEITLTLPMALPADLVGPKTMTIPRGKSEASFPLQVGPKAVAAEFTLYVHGTAKERDTVFSAVSRPLEISIAPPPGKTK